MADASAPVDPTDVGAVADVLYRLPPDRFIEQRTSFVKAARAAGDRDAARAVQGLARPTRAAWVLNLLARDQPDVVAQLVELGAGLAEAQRDLDAAALRELSDQRRALVREVSRQAFGVAGEPRPSAALAAEVQDTLTAAVVDPTVGAALQAGTLLRAAQASGFGPTGPELQSVPRRRAPEPTGRSARGKAATPAAEPSEPSKPARASAAERRAAAKAEREREQERRRAEAEEQERRSRRAEADRAVAAARDALDAARAAETEAKDDVRIQKERLRAAEQALGDAGLAVREARAALTRAERARRDLS